MAKYKVGDKVRVRSDLEVGKNYYMEDTSKSDAFVSDMEEMKGQIVTIADARGKYRIKEFRYNWTDEMFEPVAVEKRFNVFDTVKHDKYGIGTVVYVDEDVLTIDFDNWNEEFFDDDDNICVCDKDDLTLVKSYVPSEEPVF